MMNLSNLCAYLVTYLEASVLRSYEQSGRRVVLVISPQSDFAWIIGLAGGQFLLMPMRIQGTSYSPASGKKLVCNTAEQVARLMRNPYETVTGLTRSA